MATSLTVRNNVHQYCTPHSNELHLPLAKTNSMKRTFQYMGSDDFHSLPTLAQVQQMENVFWPRLIPYFDTSFIPTIFFTSKLYGFSIDFFHRYYVKIFSFCILSFEKSILMHYFVILGGTTKNHLNG